MTLEYSLRLVVVLSAAMASISASSAFADTFGSGANEFTIDFVTISGATNPTPAQTTAGGLHGFGIVEYDYRMGVHEITQEQRSRFQAGNPYWTGANMPAGEVSWYQAAQFVNWLNTSTNHQAAYNFDQAGNFQTWASADAWGGTNLYRHKDAFYFLPDEDEWFKAAYWNGATIQEYATKPGDTLHQGDGISGTGWNYYADGDANDPRGSWDVGSGSEELNGTYDMMGNSWEWIESPYNDPHYDAGSSRGLRGGRYHNPSSYLEASYRSFNSYPTNKANSIGFRVASISVGAIPEPGSVLIWGGIGLIGYVWRRRGGCGRCLACGAELGALLIAGSVQADVFNMGGTRNPGGSWTGLASLEMVPVGNPGNAGDTRYGGYAAVDYEYRIGKYEVTAGQYCEFLNAVAAAEDTYSLHAPQM